MMTAYTLIPVARVSAFDGGGYGWLLAEMLLTLGIVGLIAWLVLRWAGSHRSWRGGPISILARHPLEPRRSLYLVSVGDRVLLLGSSEAGLSTLAELSHEEIAPPSTTEEEHGEDFAARLATRLFSRSNKAGASRNATITSTRDDDKAMPSEASTRPDSEVA